MYLAQSIPVDDNQRVECESPALPVDPEEYFRPKKSKLPAMSSVDSDLETPSAHRTLDPFEPLSDWETPKQTVKYSLKKVRC